MKSIKSISKLIIRLNDPIKPEDHEIEDYEVIPSVIGARLIYWETMKNGFSGIVENIEYRYIRNSLLSQNIVYVYLKDIQRFGNGE